MASASTSARMACARLFWMLVGPIFLAPMLFVIASDGGGWLRPADIVYLVVLGLMVFARHFEFHQGPTLTTTGELATHEDLRRYTLAVPSIGLAVWVIANLIGNHWPDR